ncbi:helix-turn-helix transcriptional regulator [Novosphingobium sp. G106]|uniref:response regulator transcription factor n=1 Tax=Novosphingobium sp. G106 TaxID=2849500 RepID=UPI001C2D2F1B|nr:helix-turn-helix transcriptional regulator [Novosphingobium sp. G106]MBV1692498.1 helix-turn-helix transcriptional regulator [Novosphingobium sp. G106]
MGLQGTVLTNREFEILVLLANGFSSKEVALRCGITARTVETYLSKMRLKLGARNATNLVALALRAGLLSEDDMVLADRIGTNHIFGNRACAP